MLYLNRRESNKDKQRLNVNGSVVKSQIPMTNFVPFKNLNQVSCPPIVYNNEEQKSLERASRNTCVTNISKAYKSIGNNSNQDVKKIPYILQKRNSNSPFILKGQNFSSEDILPPNFGLEDVFLKNELKQKQNLPNSILIKNGDNKSNESMNEASPYVRYFHTSDGARNRNQQSSSLDPYRDSPPYIQHSGSNDFLGT